MRKIATMLRWQRKQITNKTLGLRVFFFFVHTHFFHYFISILDFFLRFFAFEHFLIGRRFANMTFGCTYFEILTTICIGTIESTRRWLWNGNWRLHFLFASVHFRKVFVSFFHFVKRTTRLHIFQKTISVKCFSFEISFLICMNFFCFFEKKLIKNKTSKRLNDMF